LFLTAKNKLHIDEIMNSLNTKNTTYAVCNPVRDFGYKNTNTNKIFQGFYNFRCVRFIMYHNDVHVSITPKDLKFEKNKYAIGI